MSLINLFRDSSYNSGQLTSNGDRDRKKSSDCRNSLASGETSRGRVRQVSLFFSTLESGNMQISPVGGKKRVHSQGLIDTLAGSLMIPGKDLHDKSSLKNIFFDAEVQIG